MLEVTKEQLLTCSNENRAKILKNIAKGRIKYIQEEPLIIEQDLKETIVYKEILKKIENEKELYFTEIEKVFETTDFDYKGDKNICVQGNENIIIWQGWNEQANKIIFKLLEHPNILNKGISSILEICLYGKRLPYPLVKMQNHTYKKPHWYPSKLVWICTEKIKQKGV